VVVPAGAVPVLAGLAPPELGVVAAPLVAPLAGVWPVALVAAVVEATDAVEVVEAVVVELATVAGAALAEAPLGTVSWGAPVVSGVADPPAPHATSPSDSVSPATNDAILVVRRFIRNGSY
jgi:hypothetical protein